LTKLGTLPFFSALNPLSHSVLPTSHNGFFRHFNLIGGKFSFSQFGNCMGLK
jgi:hypothetical protein